MPTLLEVQRAMGSSLLQGVDGDARAFIMDQAIAPDERLAIYRNTAIGVMVGALRLTFVAVQHVVGNEFFEGAARMFAAQSPPQSALLDEYGERFADFLAQLSQAESIAYLPDLARLEWKVSVALHAGDVPPLDATRLRTLTESQLSRLCFVSHPAVQLLRCDFPTDLVWHAVLERDDAAMAAIDLADGPIWLLIQRSTSGIELVRLSQAQWCFASALFSGQRLGEVLAQASLPDTHAALAAHLALGRIADFSVAVEPGCVNLEIEP